jgi:DNA polymerase-4
MPVSRARQLCPQAVYLETDFAAYAPASRAFHAILRRFTPVVEPAGADEAYLDVRGSERIFGDPGQIARLIREAVRSEIGITCSVGVSVNKLVSKVASDAGKPDGLVVVLAGEEAAFLAPRPIRELPMVGPKTAERLAGLGVRTIGDLAALPLSGLEGRFGSHGRELHDRAWGRYDAPVISGRAEARSVSREMTFDIDETDGDMLLAVLRSESDRVAQELAREGRCGRTVTLKLRFPPFETITRSFTPAVPPALADELYATAAALFEKAWAEHQRRPVRLLGMGVMNLQERARQLRLGERPADELDAALSALRERFGAKAVRHGIEIGRTGDRRIESD